MTDVDLSHHAISLTRCGDVDSGLEGRPILPVRPHVSNRYHFGMLLGVEDLETEQAYHRGKQWLHNAWLHRDGVVWGYEVGRADPPDAAGDNAVLRVGPGLGLDCRGRELCLDQGMCIDLGAWYDANRDDVAVEGDPDAAPRFRAHVVVRFRACLHRQVPALRDPCGDPTASTAYSRVAETVDLELAPDPSPDPPPSPYPRLRAVFGLGDLPDDFDPPDDEWERVAHDAAVLDGLDRVDEAQILANERIIGERPVFPCAEDEANLVLADVGVELRRDGERWRLEAFEVSYHRRSVLLDTRTMQDLLGGVQGSGPQVDPSSVNVQTPGFSFTTLAPLVAETVTASAFELSVLDGAGWTVLGIDGDPTLRDGRTRVTVNADVAGLPGFTFTDFSVVRLIARGTGSTPLMGDDFHPLAGTAGQRLAAGSVGADAVLDHRS